MPSRLPPALVLGAVLVLGACASGTQLRETWVAPDAQPLTMRRVLVVAIARSGTQRRAMEDAMVRALAERTQATPSYRVLRTRATDSSAVAAALADGRYDGIWTLRTIGTELRERLVPGTMTVAPWATPFAYRRFWGYWNYGWGMAGTPGYIERDQVVRLESNLYQLGARRRGPEEQLVWSGISETIDPANADRLVDGVAKAMAKELEREGLLDGARRMAAPRDRGDDRYRRDGTRGGYRGDGMRDDRDGRYDRRDTADDDEEMDAEAPRGTQRQYDDRGRPRSDYYDRGRTGRPAPQRAAPEAPLPPAPAIPPAARPDSGARAGDDLRAVPRRVTPRQVPDSTE